MTTVATSNAAEAAMQSPQQTPSCGRTWLVPGDFYITIFIVIINLTSSKWHKKTSSIYIFWINS
jgi:hypothetical protein